MDLPPRKRRRTSPRQPGRPSTSNGRPAAAAAAASTTPPDPLPPPRPPSPSKLPLFAAPTVASLARKIPEIPERRMSAPRIDPVAAAGSSNNNENIRPLARSPTRSPIRSSLRSPTRSPTRTLGSMLSEPPRRSPIKPVPRPLPPPDPQRSQDVLQPLMALDKQRSGLDLFRASDEQPEPELPPTPERPDPEMATPPSGIHHSSTPSKRPGKRRGRGRKGHVASSSPLKQPPLKVPRAESPSKTPTVEPTAGKEPAEQPTETPVEKELAAAETPTAAEAPAPSKAAKAKAKSTKTAKKIASSRKRPAATKNIIRDNYAPSSSGNSYAARGIKPPEPLADSKAERERLLAEIAELEADLALAAAENERIRVAAEQGSQATLPPNQREVFRLLRRRALSPEKETADVTDDWLQAVMNPVSLLPFGKASTNLAEMFTFGQAAAEEAEPAPPISHHPLAMTAAEELPYLSAFSPLRLRSTVVVLPGSREDAPGAPLLQKHLITATSATLPGLFMARIKMTVHSKSLRITELRVSSMDPAAAAELQPVVDRVAATSQKAAGSALVRNVTVLLWAMGEWVRVATRRARFWCVLERLVRDKDALREAVQRLRRRKKRSNNSSSSRRNEGEGENDDDELGETIHRAGAYSQAELLAQRGRRAMDVEVPQPGNADREEPAPAVRVQWSISFDWTGEAQSDVGILLGVPGKWRKADDGGRLAQVPKLFDQLMREDEDPETAVKTVVSLLAGDAV